MAGRSNKLRATVVTDEDMIYYNIVAIYIYIQTHVSVYIYIYIYI